jgi:glyoxylase-like metal-dependent hydrolase (beta-lactamase superfamily II)
MWSPMSATLIHGKRDAVLVDTLVTFEEINTLADWIDRFEKNLTAAYITHGHSDHWIGLKRLLERFPNARGLARPQIYDRATFEATNPGLSGYWQSIIRARFQPTRCCPTVWSRPPLAAAHRFTEHDRA